MTPRKLLPVGILLRISDAREEDTAGVERQEKDCRLLAAALRPSGYDGVEIVAVYTENDTSAFKRRKVRLPDGSTGLRVMRPEFRRLIDDLTSRAILGVVAYDLDRVARDPRDLEDLIDAVEMTQALTRSVTGSLDLSTDAGVTMARVMVAVANKSSRDTARRVKRKREEMAEQGVYGGGGRRRYGRAVDRKTIVPEEAEIIRECARRVLGDDERAPESLRAIALDLTRRGVPTATGAVDQETGKLVGWQPRSIHSCLTSGHITGLHTFRGEVVGEADDLAAILDRETWERVQVALAKRNHGRGQQALRKWLSGLLLCSACGHRLYGWPNPNKRLRPGGRYACPPPNTPKIGGCGKTAVDAEHAHDAIEAEILAYLRRPDNVAALATTVSADAANRAQREARDDEQQLKAAAEMWARREITQAEYLVMRREISDRLSQWQAIIRQSMPGPVRRLVSADSIEDAWAEMQPPERREVAQVIYPYGILVVPPRPTHRFKFDPDRLVRLDRPWQSK
ncbi:recombinase family protein [Amycolatopsis jiangsuensis]|uniref:DNA invertase Pin-like site-specific DNA recombinase n=1 Tax=Amycolatopsis jiangsuensis TaxID=1181879 RepID=A0A840J3Z8_9PSEU|nr:recombinase family protein [Amycolatopsis jiangsuensis]MBB4689791.1 DNA invertase Pin-like site-specific DNA recombinase [Amycolatopsis jiangsuensis]